MGTFTVAKHFCNLEVTVAERHSPQKSSAPEAPASDSIISTTCCNKGLARPSFSICSEDMKETSKSPAFSFNSLTRDLFQRSWKMMSFTVKNSSLVNPNLPGRSSEVRMGEKVQDWRAVSTGTSRDDLA
nr:hypothetical protein Itr_chr04CG01170 [Ipomoea trifida]